MSDWTNFLEPTKKNTEAQYAHCPECDTWLGCQYWSLQKSVGLHKDGTGHKITLYRLRDSECD